MAFRTVVNAYAISRGCNDDNKNIGLVGLLTGWNATYEVKTAACVSILALSSEWSGVMSVQDVNYIGD